MVLDDTAKSPVVDPSMAYLVLDGCWRCLHYTSRVGCLSIVESHDGVDHHLGSIACLGRLEIVVAAYWSWLLKEAAVQQQLHDSFQTQKKTSHRRPGPFHSILSDPYRLGR